MHNALVRYIATLFEVPLSQDHAVINLGIKSLKSVQVKSIQKFYSTMNTRIDFLHAQTTMNVSIHQELQLCQTKFVAK